LALYLLAINSIDLIPFKYFFKIKMKKRNLPGFTADQPFNYSNGLLIKSAFTKASDKSYYKQDLVSKNIIYPQMPSHRRLAFELTKDGGPGGGGGGDVPSSWNAENNDLSSDHANSNQNDERYAQSHDGPRSNGDINGDNFQKCFYDCMDYCAPEYNRGGNFRNQSQRTKFCGRSCAYKCEYSRLA
jgi:hypothetical protein